MDLDSLVGLNEIRPSVYRTSMKLLTLQRLLHMDAVSVRHVTAALHSVGGAQLSRQEVTRALNRMFLSVSQEVPGHVTTDAPEEACSLLFRLYDRAQAGCVSAVSLQTALIALSAEPLLLKYTALLNVAQTSSGSISRSGLRCLLQDLSQLPAAVQEEAVFGGVEAAVKSCFNGVLTQAVSEEHVLSWLQGEPRLLLWLPTLYRLSVSQNITHSVRCHTCKTRPITGLRYRCMKCVNVHMCQSCFLTDRQTRKHKAHHPVLEFCTQPTWRESLSSFVHNARHTLLPRRLAQREAERRRVLEWAEPGETQDRAPPPSDPSTRLVASADRDVSHDASVQTPPSSTSSKALQTEGEAPPQQALLTEFRNLQRDKWLLEQQLQAWRLTIQSEQGVLEDRCSEMEVTVETLRQQNLSLQGMLTQALTKMETQRHADDATHTPRGADSDDSPTSDTHTEDEDQEEELLMMMMTGDSWHQEEQPTPSPTMQQDLVPSHDTLSEEEESEGDEFLCQPIERQEGPQPDDTCLSEEEDCGTCSPQQLLQQTVETLKAALEADRWAERWTGERERAELLEAADLVGGAIRHLVDAVRTNTDDQVTLVQVTKVVY